MPINRTTYWITGFLKIFLNKLLLKYQIQKSGPTINIHFNELSKTSTSTSLHLPQTPRDRPFLASFVLSPSKGATALASYIDCLFLSFMLNELFSKYFIVFYFFHFILHSRFICVVPGNSFWKNFTLCGMTFNYMNIHHHLFFLYTIFYFTFIEIKFTYHTIHPYKLYNSLRFLVYLQTGTTIPTVNFRTFHHLKTTPFLVSCLGPCSLPQNSLQP